MRSSIQRSRRNALPALLLGGMLLAPSAASAQEAAAEAPVTPDRPTMSDFGHDLGDQEAGALLAEIDGLMQETIAASRSAESAGSVADVKRAAAEVVRAVWGIDPGVADVTSEVERPGWKERWQVSGAEFDPNFVARLGDAPPTITDPRALGIVGRARAVRGWIESRMDPITAAATASSSPERVVASLNNVIGWTHVTRGYKGREVQPRISLTHVWDAPPAFWNSSADTGWLYEAEAQAINILKTDYGTEVAEAREHAAALTALLQRVVDGEDANRNGTVEPIMMEGGLAAVLSEAGAAGLAAR